MADAVGVFAPGAAVGALEPWPFENPASEYRIVAGAPQASGRIDAAGATTRHGIWRCTPGAFDCVEQGDELMTVLDGRGRLVFAEGGPAVTLEPGVTLFIRDGSRVRWEIAETLTKVFFGQKDGGY